MVEKFQTVIIFLKLSDKHKDEINMTEDEKLLIPGDSTTIMYRSFCKYVIIQQTFTFSKSITSYIFHTFT